MKSLSLPVSIFVLVFLLGLLPLVVHSAPPEFNRRVYSQVEGDSWARSGMVPFDLLIDRLEEADIVFLGEHHGDYYSHKMQLEILEALTERHNGNIALSMEHFERDVQGVLDDYLSGKITEEEFLENSRPWPNYDPDYLRLIEFCKQHNIPVMAGNVPRPIASRVSKEGLDKLLASLSDEERGWIANDVSKARDLYWDLFLNVMGQMMGHGEGFDEARIYEIFGAQCVKDDTMAETVARLRDADPTRVVIHVNGSFHSDYRLGTVSRVIDRRPGDKVLTVALRPGESWSLCTLDYETTDGQGGGEVPVGDYIVYVQPMEPEEPAEDGGNG